MRTRDEPLDPRVAADLATIDRTLSGAGARGEGGDLAELASLLRAERPAPTPTWTEELDRRAAAGFPRGGGDEGSGRWSWFGGGWMAPAGALATLAVAVVIAINVGGSGEQTQAPTDSASSSSATSSKSTGAFDRLEQVPDVPSADTGAGLTGELAPTVEAYPRRAAEKIAPGTDNRKVDRNAQLTLSARPDDVRDVTDEVITITRSLGGIVVSSQVSETGDGSEAMLQLTLPTRNVDAALDRMTDLADVDALNETTEDITKPFVSAQDRVKDAKAKREELLRALGNATSDAEAQALEIRIADARREIARAEARFDQVAREARLSDLTVRVVSDANASAERSLGDWADDALDVLRGLAGVLLIAAAILVPLALIAAFVYLIATAIRRRRRDRALD